MLTGINQNQFQLLRPRDRPCVPAHPLPPLGSKTFDRFHSRHRLVGIRQVLIKSQAENGFQSIPMIPNDLMNRMMIDVPTNSHGNHEPRTLCRNLRQLLELIDHNRIHGLNILTQTRQIVGASTKKSWLSAIQLTADHSAKTCKSLVFQATNFRDLCFSISRQIAGAPLGQMHGPIEDIHKNTCVHCGQQGTQRKTAIIKMRRQNHHTL